MAARHHIGTSGFTYDHWQGVFYPPEVKKRAWLEYYAGQFDTVEINASFYHMPRANVCRSWASRTPEGFVFVMKLNRWITHRKKLTDCGEELAAFLAAVGELGGKLGPILVQLPPGLHADAPRLAAFLDACPRERRWAVEFRHASWLCDDTFAVLREHDAALVVHDLIRDHPHVATAGWAYLRFHGPGKRYSGCYTDGMLAAAAEEIRGHLAAGRDAYAYFNNDVGGHAVANARTLKALLSA